MRVAWDAVGGSVPTVRTHTALGQDEEGRVVCDSVSAFYLQASSSLGWCQQL